MDLTMIKTFWPQIQATLLGWGRNGLALAAGVLVQHGYMAKDQTQDFIGAGFFFVALMLHILDVVAVNHKVTHPAGATPAPAQTKGLVA